MSVHGGRFWWRRAASLGGLVGVATFSLVVGCGGRTSMLDSDAYGVGMEDIGDNTGGTQATGGRPSTSGGKTSGDAGNSPGAASSVGGQGGTNGDLLPSAIEACAAYCPGYASQCPQRLMGQDCLTACIKELTGPGVRCQQIGVNAVSCLAPYFTPGGADCDTAVNRGLLKCGELVSGFERCNALPTPPVPMRPADVSGCPSAGTGNENLCERTYRCADGPYHVYCATDLHSRRASCTCLRPDGAGSGTSFTSTVDVCDIAAQALCN